MNFKSLTLLMCPLGIGLQTFSLAAYADKPSLQLAKPFSELHVNDLDGYWVSEKLDGVRAYWNGQFLVTRNGYQIECPPWFTWGWPAEPLDGELWLGRGRFDELSSLARGSHVKDDRWRKVKFMVFDLPNRLEPFNQRLLDLKALVKQTDSAQLNVVEQWQVGSHEELQAQLQTVVSKGGEGLMLHRGGSLYQATRSWNLQKMKLTEDAEAVVIGIVPGKGKYEGMMGALIVETPEGQVFKIGTGFSLEERKQPPVLGSLVTYRFRGLTGSGKPRFASFIRQRDPAL